MDKKLIAFVIGMLFGITAEFAVASPESHARRIWDRIVGGYSSADAPKVAEMAQLIRNGQIKEAAAIATQDKRFIDITIRRLAGPWSNRNKDVNSPYNSMIALIQGSVRDKRDFREVFYGNYLYVVRPGSGLNADNAPAMSMRNDNHFTFIDTNALSANDVLELQPGDQYVGATQVNTGDVNAGFHDFAGVFTTTGARFLYDAGTNRRPVEWAFNTMLCKDMSQVFDISRGDAWVGRDVDRADVAQYQTKCVGCHGGALDGLRGAFAYINTNNNALQMRDPAGNPQGKFNANIVFADGYQTRNDRWENRATANHNIDLGWKGPVSGQGIAAFGKMFAETDQFSRCMASHVFTNICARAPSEKEKAEILRSIAVTDFEDKGYQLNKLFEAVAAQPTCIPQ